tara:strand:+ start:2777 stop:3178 length:402 start_codon:yes stop_codon:yes gene_type:complete
MHPDNFWFGLGFICADIQFNFSMQKSASSVNGFRILRSISFRSYKKQQQNKNENAFLFLNEVLEKFGLPYDERITKTKEIEKWMTMISHFKLQDRLSDRQGYLNLKWVLENPPPTGFESFVEWVKEVENSIQI